MKGFERIIGQDEIVRRLSTLRDFYHKKQSLSEHIILAGPAGMGQKVIVQAFAEELGCTLKAATGRLFERKGDLTAVLTSLEDHEVLYVDGIQEMKQPVHEILECALQRFEIQLVIGQGPGARVHPFKLNRFTCIASVPKESDCPPSLRDAFSVLLFLSPYTEANLSLIAANIARDRGLEIPPRVAELLASASGRTPHRLEKLLERLERSGQQTITEPEALQILEVLGLTTPARGVPTHLNLERLSGVEFESVIADLLQRMGFKTEITRATGDGGIDIVAVLSRPVVGGRYLIQCKRFSSKTLVGAPLVREFYGALVADSRAVKGILITTSTFTAQALEFARSLPLELIDIQQLRALLLEHGMQLLG